MIQSRLLFAVDADITREVAEESVISFCLLPFSSSIVGRAGGVISCRGLGRPTALFSAAIVPVLPLLQRPVTDDSTDAEGAAIG